MPDAEQSPTPTGPELRIKRPVDRNPSRPRIVKTGPITPVVLKPATAADAGPAFLRVLLWIALMGWLLFLAFKLLDPLPFLFPDEDNTSAHAWWRIEQAATPAARDSGETETALQPDDPELVTLKRHVAAALLAGSFGEALGLVERQQQSPDIYPYQEQLTGLADYVRTVSRINTTVADAIRERIDEEVVIRVKGRRFTIRPRASAGERINALIIPDVADGTKRSTTFSVTDLDPIERAHWIGKADTPGKCAMKLLLHMKAGDRDAARVFAPGCGILAKAFEAELGAAGGAGAP